MFSWNKSSYSITRIPDDGAQNECFDGPLKSTSDEDADENSAAWTLVITLSQSHGRVNDFLLYDAKSGAFDLEY